MSDEATRFTLSFNGISIEIEGDKDFVEEMYREVMADIEEAKRRIGNTIGARSGAAKASAKTPKLPTPQERVIWVYRCNPLVHKIYMTSVLVVAENPAFEAFEPQQLNAVYVEEPLLTKLMPQFNKGQTLWAELTAHGREKIAEASAGNPANRTTLASHGKIGGVSSTS